MSIFPRTPRHRGGGRHLPIAGAPARALGLACLIACLGLAGCAGHDLPVDAAPDDILTHADKQLAAEDWFDAAETLEFFIRSHPGNSRMPYAKLRLGDARYGLGEYVLARGEYEDVVDDYPASPFVEEARFKIARCVYASIYSFDRDPAETEEALGLLVEFRREYPDSRWLPEAEEALADCRDRLARKEFEAGRFYEGQHRLRSAKIQYEYVLTEYPRTVWAPQARFRLGEIYRIRRKWETARDHYRHVLEDYPGTEAATLAEHALADMADRAEGSDAS